MKSKKFGGIALLGAAALGGLYLMTKTSGKDVTDLGGGSALGTGGSTAIVPGAEKPSTPPVYGEDSVATGIEDDDTPENYGAVDYSDSGSTDIPSAVIDKKDNALMDIGLELAPYAGLSIVGSLSNFLLKKGSTAEAGSVFARLGAGSVAGGALRVVSRAVPVIGGMSLASDLLVGRAGDGGGMTVLPHEGNSVLEDVFNEHMAGIPDTKMDYVGATKSSLDEIAGTPAGTVWEQTYSATKTGASQSRGITTNTYQASTGAQVALAGISADDYAAYLAEKGRK